MPKVEWCDADRIADGKLLGKELDAQALFLFRNRFPLRPQRQPTSRHAQFVVCIPTQALVITASAAFSYSSRLKGYAAALFHNFFIVNNTTLVSSGRSAGANYNVHNAKIC